jgi:hypothetical protein
MTPIPTFKSWKMTRAESLFVMRQDTVCVASVCLNDVQSAEQQSILSYGGDVRVLWSSLFIDCACIQNGTGGVD